MDEINQQSEQLKELIGAVGKLSQQISRQEERLDKMEYHLNVVPKPASTPVRDFVTASKAVEEAVTAPQSTPQPQKTFAAPPSAPVAQESFESEIGLKWLGRIGIFALIIGVGFFLKYAFDNNWIGPAGRVAIGILGGLLMTVIGEFLRKKYDNFSQMITGGGIAILYLSIYGAYNFYHLVGQPAAFVAMILITIFSGALAIHYEALGLAAIGIFGGFLTPILLSTGENSQVALFSYIALLNVGILGISFFRNWRVLNLLGLVGTAIIFITWYSRFYTAAQLFSTEFFLTVFFVIYAIGTIVHNILHKQSANEGDAALVLINALAYFGMSYKMLNPEYHAYMGFFAVVMALFYFVLAIISYKNNPEDKKLALFLPSLSVLFLVLAAPIQFKGNWITIAWSVEAMILVWLGFALDNPKMRVFGWIVFMLSGIRMIFLDSRVANLESYIIFFNKRFFTFIVGVASSFGIYSLYTSYKEKLSDMFDEEGARTFMIIAANFLLLWALSAEVISYYDKQIAISQKEVYLNVPYKSQLVQYNSRVNPQNQQNDYVSQKFAEEQYAKQQAAQKKMYEQTTASKNQRNVALSVLWAVYAIILSIVGIFGKNKAVRVAGIILFAITIMKLFFYDLWNLGSLYRIISSISLGMVLILASFAYNKYKDKIKEII